MFMKTIYFLSLFFCFNLFAKEAATVLLMRGKVELLVKDQSGKQTTFAIAVGDKIEEKSVVITGDKSFVKLIFIDKSQMNLGPNSQMEVTEFPKNEAGIINLVKGELRSKVTKDYMDMDKKDQSKLFIKTKTAAMGVRGTEFKVIFNPENNITSLVTFEGRVAMAAIDERSPADINTNQRALEQAVSSPDAQMVTQGQYSGVNPGVGQGQPTEPVKINPQQLESLKANENGIQEGKDPTSASAEGNKNFRSPIPPGVESKTFANNSNSIDKSFQAKDNATTTENKTAEPAAVQNSQMSGGFIDLKTALYIPPPPGSAFDANTGMYVPPSSYGSVNTNGEYVAPKGFELKASGEFAQVKFEGQNRGPASEENQNNQNPGGPGATGGLFMPPPMNVNVLQNNAFNGGSPTFNGEFGTGQTAFGPPPPNFCIECLQKDIQRELAERQQVLIQESTTRAIFNVTAN
jgi:hypothetical protein